jgi:SAM-dependent methyltransferase
VVPALRRRIRLLTYRGDAVDCPCCGRGFRAFMRPDPELLNAVCPWCGNHIRHSALWLYLERRTDLLSKPARVLHIAPEHILQQRLSALGHLEYVSADLESPLAMEHWDLTDVPHPDDSFDAIVCSHVLEHVPDDRRAMSELRRILRPGGWAIVQVPIDYTRAETLEDPAIQSPEDREREYWQSDHMRLYGNDFPDRLRAAGLDVTVDRYLRDLPQDEIDRFGLISLEDIYLCREAGDAPPG